MQRKLKIKSRTPRSKYQKGVVLPIIAAGMLAILGIAGMAIDLGNAHASRTALQSALDAAALSGARTLNNTDDEALANEHATDAFEEHLVGVLSADEVALALEFSATLDPFAPGTPDPNYVRARVVDLDIPFSFSQILPGIGASTPVAATAVAGPIPIGGGETCDLAPLLMCGTPGDTDCSDGFCYGIEVGEETEYCLKSGSGGNGGNGNGNGNGNGGNNNQTGGGNNSDQCDGDPNCVPCDASDDVGPGNFQLIRLGCNGGDCIRDNLAGGFQGCLANMSAVQTEPGNTVGPTRQGFNTRFGIYNGPVNASEFPPDLIVEGRDTNPDFWHEDYVAATAAAIDAGSTNGVPQRREMAVPIVNCDGTANGQTTIPTLGIGCFFMTRPIVGNGGQENQIYGQFIEDCEASGTPGPNLGAADPGGPFIIILFKDFNSTAS